MNKILFVIPPSPDRRKIIRLIDCSHETKANYLWQPNDFMIVTSLLKADDEVILVDGTCDELSDTDFIARITATDKTDIIFCAMSSVCWDSDYAYFLKVADMCAGIPLYVTGDIFLERHYQDIILEKCSGIVFQPYLLDMDRMIHRTTGSNERLRGVCTMPGEDVPGGNKQIIPVSVPAPRHESFLKSGYRFPFARHLRFATVTTMWGCPFSCSYCTDSKFAPIVRDLGGILEELAVLESLKVKELFFADKTFGYYHKTSIPLLEQMKKKHSFSWSCYFHPQTYDPKLLDLMSEAGCHTIIIGVDTANLASLHKYGRHVSQNKLDSVISHANRLDMSICADFIIGLEHESKADVERTVQYALNLPIDFISLNIAAPLPGSDIREKALQRGTLRLGEEGFDTLGLSGVLGNDRLDPDEIKRIRKKAIRTFYLRPQTLVKRLRKTKTLEHFLIQIGEMVSMFRKM